MHIYSTEHQSFQSFNSRDSELVNFIRSDWKEEKYSNNFQNFCLMIT